MKEKLKLLCRKIQSILASRLYYVFDDEKEFVTYSSFSITFHDENSISYKKNYGVSRFLLDDGFSEENINNSIEMLSSFTYILKSNTLSIIDFDTKEIVVEMKKLSW